MFTIRGTWMRGGTSKCWLFNAVDIDPLIGTVGSLDTILAAAFGSGDPRQLDGIGGGSSTTSKAAIVRRSVHDDVDIDYLFAQVAIADRSVEWGSNCGNCATAIGLYAIQAGLVPAHPDSTRVRMRNENTGAVLTAEIATPGGHVPFDGDAIVPGAAAPGVPVDLTFNAPVSRDRTLLPTGNPIDHLILGASSYPATLISAGAPAVLIDARDTDLGIVPTDSLEQISTVLPALVSLRRLAALRMGLCGPGDPVSHAIPKIGIVGSPEDYVTTAGAVVSAADYDIAVRMISMMAPHPAIGLTAAVAVAAAATVADSVVFNAASGRKKKNTLRIGTAAGVVPVDITMMADGQIGGITLHRAARRIASAELFIAPPVRELLASA